MKNVFKLFLMSVILFPLMSCIQEVSQITETGKESVSFSFRAAAGLDGYTLDVNLIDNKKGNVIARQEKTITPEERNVTFNFTSILVGTNVKVTASVKNNKGEDIYKGESPVIEVKKGDNNNIKLSLQRVRIKLSFVYENLNLSEHERNNARFEILINDVPKKNVNIKDIQAGEGRHSITLDDYFEIGKVINVTARIVDGNNVIYSLEKQHEVVDKDANVVSLNMSRKNVYLNVSSNGVDLSNFESSYFVIYKDNEKVTDVSLPLKDNATSVTIPIGYVPLESKIKTEIKASDGKTVLYSSDEHVVSGNDSIIAPELIRRNLFVTVSTKLDNTDNTIDYKGADFKVRVNNGEWKSITINENNLANLSIGVGYFECGSKLNIEAVVQKNETVICSGSFNGDVTENIDITLSKDTVPVNVSFYKDILSYSDVIGAEFKVSVNNQTKSVAITNKDNPPFVNIGNYNIGDTVSISASIEKDNVILYKGKKEHKVMSKENVVLSSTEFPRKNISLNVVPSIPYLEDYTNVKLKVTVGSETPKEESVSSSSDKKSINIGYRAVGSTLDIEVALEKAGSVMFSKKITYTVTTGNSDITVDFGERNKVPLTVSFDLSSLANDINGAVLDVTVDFESKGESQTITNKAVNPINIGNFNADSQIIIDVVIKKDISETNANQFRELYTGRKTITVSDSEKNISFVAGDFTRQNVNITLNPDITVSSDELVGKKLVIYENNSVKRTVEISNNPQNLEQSIGYIPVGNTIKAEIKDRETVLYGSDEHTVGKDDNIVTLSMVRKNVEVVVKPSANLPDTTDAKFYIKLGTGNLIEGTMTGGINIGYQSVGSTLNISSQIKKGEYIIYDSSEKSYPVSDSTNEIIITGLERQQKTFTVSLASSFMNTNKNKEELNGKKFEVTIDNKTYSGTISDSVSVKLDPLNIGSTYTYSAYVKSGNDIIFQTKSQSITVESTSADITVTPDRKMSLVTVSATISNPTVDLAGSTFNVTIGDKEPINAEYNSSDKSFTTNPVYVAIGNVTINAEIKDGNNILYSGTATHTVTNNTNTVTVNLERKKADLVVNINCDGCSNFTGKTVEITMGGGVQQRSSTNKITLKELNVGDTVTIETATVKEGDVLLYKLDKTFTCVVSNNPEPVSLSLVSVTPKYVLWSDYNNDSNVGYSEAKTPRYQIFNVNDINADININTSQKEFIDFYIDNNQNVWTIEAKDATVPTIAIKKYSDNIDEGTTIVDNITIDNSLLETGGKPVITSYYDTIKRSEMVLYTTGQNKISYYNVSNTADKKDVTFTSSSGLQRSSVTAITSYGNQVYVAEYGYSSTDGYFIFNIGSINENNNELNNFFFGSEPISINGTEIVLSYCKVTDMKVIDNTLYALILCTKSSTSKGGILQIDLSTKSVVAKMFYTSADVTYESGYGNMEENVAETSLNTCLVGPRKFVAVKPKKLVIADDGMFTYTDLSQDPSSASKNRVVTIDIGDFVNENIDLTNKSIDLTNIKFTGCYKGSVSCGYIYYPE